MDYQTDLRTLKITESGNECSLPSLGGSRVGVIRVLIIEDNPGDARLIQELLHEGPSNRFEFEEASRLTEGLRLLNEKDFDVVLLDLGLPDSRGIDTLTRALKHAGKVPVVVLTGTKEERVGMEASRLGAQDYLSKGEVSGEMIERSILYSIERKRAQEEIRNALQTFADVVSEIPSGLLTFQFCPPDQLKLRSFNPRAAEILKIDLKGGMGRDIHEFWPASKSKRWKEMLLDVLRTKQSTERECVTFRRENVERALNLRAFAIPEDRVCLSLEDVTDRIREEELRTRAYAQIEKNIEHFATLVDEIRNPNSVIIGLAEKMGDDTSKSIIIQAERIENIINRLDDAWIASEKLRLFLKKN